MEAVEGEDCTHSCELCTGSVDTYLEESSSEKSSSVESPTEEFPSEELPSEELPTEEFPSEELPSEELPTEELPPGQNGGIKDACTCDTLCTKDSVNPDCPVCSAEGADFTKCVGTKQEKSFTYDAVVALFQALPKAASITKETTDEEKDELMAQINVAVAALENLSDEEFAKFNEKHSALLEAVMALQAALINDTPTVLVGNPVVEILRSGAEGNSGGEFDTLAAAINEAQTGDTLKIIADIDLGTTGVTISGKSLTLNLNGKTITYSGDRTAITLSDGVGLNVTDDGSGGIVKATSGSAIWNNSTGTVMVEGGTVTASGSSGSAIDNNSTGTVAVNGGTVSASGYSGTAINNSTGTVMVTDGTVSASGSSGIAIWNTSTGTVTVEGGTVSASDSSGIAIRTHSNGTVTVSGTAKVTSTNTAVNEGTIFIYEAPSDTPKNVLEITGGTVENTAVDGYAVYFTHFSVTSANVSSYYSRTGGTVGKIYPEPLVIPTPTVEYTYIYANGAEINIVAGTTPGYTNILYDQNGDGTIEDTEYLKIGDSDPTEAGYDLAEYTIYGGSRYTDLTCNIKITMTGGKVYYVFGGGSGKKVTGNTEIIISGGTVDQYIYGGGNAGEVTGNTSVTIGKDAMVGGVFGGGFTGTVGTAGSQNTVTVTVSGKVNSVNGGGSNGAVNGNISIMIVETAAVSGNVYGNGSGGVVTGNISIMIAATATVSGRVYGCGSYSSGAVNGDVDIKITGTVSDSVYGSSGSNAVTGKTTLTIGGGAKVGDDHWMSGVRWDTFSDSRFAIEPALTDDARISVYLPFTIAEGSTIATNATEADPAKINLTGNNVANKEAYFDNTDSTIKVRTVVPPTITSVTVSTNSAAVQKGTSQQFTAIVSGTNNPAATVNWSLSGANKTGTSISTDGLLTVAVDETAATLTVKATSTVDPSKSGTAMVTVLSADKSALAAAIDAANNAKSGVIVSDSPASSVANGTKFVNTADMEALNNAIAVAQTVMDHSDAAVEEIAAAVSALNRAVAVFHGAIKTGSSGSSSSGSSDSNSSVTPPAEAKPSTPTEGEIKVEGTVDASGNVTVTLPGNTVDEAIKKAEDEARKNGNLSGGVTLALNISTGSGNPDSVTVDLPKLTQETIINKKIANTVIMVDKPDIKIAIDLPAIQSINNQANADVNIIATKRNGAELTGAAKAAIGSRPVYEFKVHYSGGKQLTSFEGGSISVAIPYILGAGEQVGGVSAVYVDNNGNVNYLTKSVYDSVNNMLRFSTNHFSTYGVGYQAPAEFTDLSEHWAKDDIQLVVNRGLINGTDTTTFSPDAPMTRGMFVTALGRLAGADVSSYKESSFTDVKADAYYMGYVEWAVQQGIIKGATANTFGPDGIVTREQMADMMAKYAKAIGYSLPKAHEQNTFADAATISTWAADSVKAMQMAGVLAGKNGNQLVPRGTATRGEAAVTLRRFMGLMIDVSTVQGWMRNDDGQWMYYENGKPVKNTHKNVDGEDYGFDAYGITPDFPKKKIGLPQ